MRHALTSLVVFAVIFAVSARSFAVMAETHQCPQSADASKQVYWGDLHVHTAYSLDAWGFGTLQNPAQAYAFGRGQAIDLPAAGRVKLDRPLDFMAVTDHAEWFDLLYICTDPQWSENPYCNTMTEKNNALGGSEVFLQYVIPTITRSKPQPTPLCAEDAAHCTRARLNQWQRIQQQTNQANDPCTFTTFNGYEWSATPDFSHTHRNIIFASDKVTAEAIDYMRFTTPVALWTALSRQCRPADGCEAISIPHNSNMGDGKSFEVEAAAPDALALRRQYERLIEIHQEKGNSECLSAAVDAGEDCNFEIRLTQNSRLKKRAAFSAADWEQMRRGYVRGLLLKGLAAYTASGNTTNPLQLGIIASTDGHAATAGFVSESKWQGPVFGLGSFDRLMTRLDWNPGGLVAIWAEENTRAALFSALKRREVYATSGPRITVRFDAATDADLSCDSNSLAASIPMGGEFTESQFSETRGTPVFIIQAKYDQIPLASIEIIKGEYKQGRLIETVTEIWQGPDINVCVTWQDPDFALQAPAFWYARVKQSATPRWSAVRCKAAGRCDEFPGAASSIQERAWSSPIWYLPGSGSL